MYQRFHIDVVFPAYNFIKTRLQHGVYPLNFANLFSLQLHEKRGSSRGLFWWIFPICLSCHMNKNETLVQVFPCELWEFSQSATLLRTRLPHGRFHAKFAKICKTPILQNFCKGLFLIIWLLLDSFVNFIVH